MENSLSIKKYIYKTAKFSNQNNTSAIVGFEVTNFKGITVSQLVSK